MFLSKTPRKFEVILTRLRILDTSKYPTAFLWPKKIARCTASGVPVTIKHILTKYRIFRITRTNLILPESFTEFSEITPNPKPTLPNLSQPSTLRPKFKFNF